MTNGLVVMTPTSIAYSGTSASINADGSVVFSACSSLSLNGVFTGDYDNYMVAMRSVSTASTSIVGWLRAGGVNNTTASSYVYQTLVASGTSIAGARTTNNTTVWQDTYATQRTGVTIYFFGPYLAQPTAYRTVSALDESSARIGDIAGTHNQSTAYDGFTMVANSGTITGKLTVFGFNQ